MLARDKFLSEMHCKEEREKTQKLKWKKIYLPEQIRQALFSTWYGLPGVGWSNKKNSFRQAWCDDAFEIACDSKCDGYKRGLPSIIYYFSNRNVSDTTQTVTGIYGALSDTIPENQQLPNKLHKPITRRFNKRKIFSEIPLGSWPYI